MDRRGKRKRHMNMKEKNLRLEAVFGCRYLHRSHHFFPAPPGFVLLTTSVEGGLIFVSCSFIIFSTRLLEIYSSACRDSLQSDIVQISECVLLPPFYLCKINLWSYGYVEKKERFPISSFRFVCVCFNESFFLVLKSYLRAFHS